VVQDGRGRDIFAGRAQVRICRDRRAGGFELLPVNVQG